MSILSMPETMPELFRAILDEDVQQMKQTLAIGADREQVYDGRTPLLYAAKLGRTCCVEELLASGADPTVSCHNTGNGLLHELALNRPEMCSVEFLDALRQRGVDIHHRNKVGLTPLLLGVRHWHTSRFPALNALLDVGADPHGIDVYGNSGLSLLLANTVREVFVRESLAVEAQLIQRMGWDLDSAHRLVSTTQDGQHSNQDMPLPWAARYVPGWVPVLLEAGACVDVRDAHGCTALMNLAEHAYTPGMRGHLSAALVHLVAHGASWLACNAQGETPYDILQRAQDRDFANTLRLAGGVPRYVPISVLLSQDAWQERWRCHHEAAVLHDSVSPAQGVSAARPRI